MTDNVISQTQLWSYLKDQQTTTALSYQDITAHFGLDETSDTYREQSQALLAGLRKLEKIGALAISGTAAPQIFLQQTLPMEIDINFNVPKQTDKAPNIALADRSLVTRKAGKVKFLMPKITLESDLDLTQLRSISKASAYVYRAEDGRYMAQIKEVINRKTPKIKTDDDSPFKQIKSKNAANKSTVAVDVLNQMGIPHQFPQDALDETDRLIAQNPDAAELLSQDNRVDLRDLPFITIDGEYTKTRDDAIYAHADTDESNPNGHVLWVAVADVGHYIRPGSALDREAEKRGASLYLPRMNVPMVPHELAENLLSFDENQNRACLAYEMKISESGEVISHKIHQGVMRSKAALNYDQVAQALLGNADHATSKIKQDLLEPLSAVHDSLKQDFDARGAIDHTLAEEAPSIEEEATAHRIISLAMQAARSCAGDDQNNADGQGVYRSQAQPERLNQAAIDNLINYGLLKADEINTAADITPSKINELFIASRDSADPETTKKIINTLLPQSKFTTDNVGHFTVAAPAYAPLTNPIRDFASLLTGRRLKSIFNLKSGAMDQNAQEHLNQTLTKLTQIEARSKSAHKKVTAAMMASGNPYLDFRKALNGDDQYAHLLEDQDVESAILKSLGIPVDFPDEVKSEIESIVATQSNPADLLDDPMREDLTHLPFVTIDGADARDFDDAVYSHPDEDPANKGGNILWVAIADVAHYVRPGTALDLEARKRGNSVYLPKNVVPMLPEELSNGLCSLRPDEHRACMAYEIKINKKGRIIQRQLHQGVMMSKARLTYDQVMNATEGNPDEHIAPIYDSLITPLVKTYETLKAASEERGAISFGLTQMSIHVLDDDERPEFKEIKENTSRCLIAEEMIAANMCASMDQRNAKRGVYRIHDDPAAGNIEALEELKILGVITHLEIQNGIDKSQANMSRLLSKAEDCNNPDHAKKMIVRLLARAEYSTDNIGHFGLQIPDSVGYSHFTSPIRRYPDLLVHRNLKNEFNLASDMMPGQLSKELQGILEECSMTERRANDASQKASEQYVMRHLAKLEGEIIKAKISGASAEDGIRITIADLNLETYIKIRDLPKGTYKYDSVTQSLVNEDAGHVFYVGHTINVTIPSIGSNNESLPVFKLASPDQMIPDASRGKKTMPTTPSIQPKIS
jgi:ribonuclease R